MSKQQASASSSAKQPVRTVKHPSDAGGKDDCKYWVMLSFHGECGRKYAERLKHELVICIGSKGRIFLDDDYERNFRTKDKRDKVIQDYKKTHVMIALMCEHYLNLMNPRDEFLSAWFGGVNERKKIMIIPLAADVRIDGQLAVHCHCFDHNCRMTEVVDDVVDHLAIQLGEDVRLSGQALHLFENWNEAAKAEYEKKLIDGQIPKWSKDKYHIFNCHVALAGTVGLSAILGKLARISNKLSDLAANWCLYYDLLVKESVDGKRTDMAGDKNVGLRANTQGVVCIKQKISQAIYRLCNEFEVSAKSHNMTQLQDRVDCLSVYLEKALPEYVFEGSGKPFIADLKRYLAGMLVLDRPHDSDENKGVADAVLVTARGMWEDAETLAQELCIQADELLSNKAGGKAFTQIHKSSSGGFPKASRDHIDRLAPQLRRLS